MFEVGFTEIVLILGIALSVLGPEKLPKLANQVGRWAGRARAMARQLRQQLDEEVAIIPKEDFDLAARRPPGTPPPGTPPPADSVDAADSTDSADKTDEYPRLS
ncbi:MAG: Sec-independent protein translocase protein TatB [Steroidobacteraceae bacterium]